tara:strand:- start:289 stop:1272 length:984 start_codon:yes stop_codon:yes gene_type:complete
LTDSDRRRGQQNPLELNAVDDRQYRAKFGRRAVVASLRKQAAAYFIRKGLPVHPRYPYRLDSHANWKGNIILEPVARLVEQEAEKRKRLKQHFALHSFIHHGLSSQALLWNLLGPLIVDTRWDILTEILRAADISLQGKVDGAELEVEDASVLGEYGGQPTSVDMCLTTTARERVFVEFKFTEAGFGGCSVFGDGDCDGYNPAHEFDLCYLHRRGRQYWPLMKKHRLVTGSLLTDAQCPFTNLYQVYRLILYTLEQGGHFLLLHDGRNPAFVNVDRQGRQRGLFARALESLPKDARTRYHALSVQRMLDLLEPHGLGWLPELKEKHF